MHNTSKKLRAINYKTITNTWVYRPQNAVKTIDFSTFRFNFYFFLIRLCGVMYSLFYNADFLSANQIYTLLVYFGITA
ncbi:MAG: hypothetical protein ACPG5M_08250 [Winogradskyella sp.]